MDQTSYAPPTADAASIAPKASSPVLWNPGAAAGLSLLFTPIFGAVIHMKNWQLLGEPEKAAESKVWVFISVFVVLCTSAVSFIFPESKSIEMVCRFAGIALLIAWYFQNAKHQNAYVLTRFGSGYPRRGWGVPIVYALLATAGFLVFVIVTAVVAGG